MSIDLEKTRLFCAPMANSSQYDTLGRNTHAHYIALYQAEILNFVPSINICRLGDCMDYKLGIW